MIVQVLKDLLNDMVSDMDYSDYDSTGIEKIEDPDILWNMVKNELESGNESIETWEIIDRLTEVFELAKFFNMMVLYNDVFNYAKSLVIKMDGLEGA